jgi:hypothetical protein
VPVQHSLSVWHAPAGATQPHVLSDVHVKPAQQSDVCWHEA